MRFSQFFRIDLLAYAVALFFFVFTWGYRGQAIDIQLYDAYFTLSYNFFHWSISPLLLTTGFVYTLAVALKRMPSKLLSLGFIGCASSSLTVVLAAFFNGPSAGYYTYHEVDNTSMLVTTAFAVLFLIGILFFIGSLVRAKRI
jgi:hypothetical protein